MPQAAYQSLLTPYVYFGLGRTNNYIENLFVGSTKHTDQHYINMEGVIPNSKVVIIPPVEGDMWRKELYLRPGEWIPWVTVAVVAALFILAIIVLVLHLNEKVRSAAWKPAVANLVCATERGRAREETSITPHQLRRIIVQTLLSGLYIGIRSSHRLAARYVYFNLSYEHRIAHITTGMA